MEITSADFVKSSSQLEECPAPKIPEYAFIGRSNVGKSSLINLLTKRRKLAKTSSTPGKTQLINHFLVNETWYLVDLPGYGWAQVSKKEKEKWKKMIEDYLLGRENLACVFLLVDSRHEPQQLDIAFMEWMGEEEVPFAVVFTKADKLGKTQIQSNVSKYKKVMLNTWEELPTMFITSSEEKVGGDDILEFIGNVNESIGEL